MSRNDLSTNDLHNDFLPELKRSAPEATYQTHWCIVESLTQFIAESNRNVGYLSAEDVAEFIRNDWNDLHQATVKGKVSSLGNILGYLWHDDPAVCKRQVAVALNEQLGEESDWNIPMQTLTESERICVELLRDWLDQHQYGSRLHAVVELMIDTHARPSIVRQVNNEDLNLQEATLEISLPSTHALSQNEIRKTRTVELSPYPHDVLCTYWNHYRQTPTAGDQDALFTTTFGRVSCSTLSRDCRTASEKAYNSITHDELMEQYPVGELGIIYQNVSLRQIWIYSLDTIAHSEQ